MAGYWRTGGHDEPSEHDRPERLEQQTDRGHGYGHINENTISDEELLSFFGVKSWDEYIERHQSDESPDLDEYTPPAYRERKAEEADQPAESEQLDQPERTRLWQTIAEETGEDVRSYPSYSAARRDLGSQPGMEIHHVVEQAQAKPERSGFSVERINSTDNMTRIPEGVHREISARYSRNVPMLGETLRNRMNDLSWDEQREYGARVLDEVFNRREGLDDDQRA